MESEKQVIAVKQKGSLRGAVIVLVLGVILFALGVILLIYADGVDGIVAFSCGVICVLFGIAGICSVCSTPAEIVTYEDGLLHFADGTTCEPWEIVNMTALPVRTRYYDLSSGSLVVTVRGENKTYENIADVQEAYKKIKTLIRKSVKSGGGSETTEWTEVSEEEESDGEFDG